MWDLETGEVLEQGVPLRDTWLEDMDQWVRWTPEPILVQESSPLEPIREVPMEVEVGTMLVQQDSARAEEENSTAEEQAAQSA